MTNFERIKQMSVKELAIELSSGFNCEFCKYNDADGNCRTPTYPFCIDGFLSWLEEEAEDDADECDV